MRRILPLVMIMFTLAACGGTDPTPADPTPAAEEETCPPEARISDVTIASGSTLEPGVPFDKVWRIENRGPCDWPAGYTFVLTDGDTHSAPRALTLPQVASGEAAEVSAAMEAPGVAGRYTLTRQLRTAEGVPFGPAAVFQFLVEGAEPTLSVSDCTPGMTFIEDVSIPDDTFINAGDTFTKTWRLQNSGSCDWGAGYSLVFYEGRQMEAAASVPITATAPGEVLDLSIEMTAPDQQGTHTGIWYMQDPTGTPFGIPPYVRIIVVNEGGSQQADADQPAATVVPAASGGEAYSGQPITTAQGCTLNAGFVADVTINDYAVIQPGREFTKTWRLQNTGSCDWSEEYAIIFAGGTLLTGETAYPVPAVAAGETTDISLGMTAPDQPGTHTSIWRLQAPDGTLFGIEPYVAITVPGNVASTAPYPNISGITANARQIWLDGQQRGRQPNVFSKVGDSITFAYHFMTPIGEGNTVYGPHEELAPAVDHFMSGQARITNPFANPSLAAFPGWQAQDLHDPTKTEDGCADMTPLQCEYNFSNPSVAIIMIGTNDCNGRMPLDVYAANLNRTVEETIEAGIIPVLSTIPHSHLCDVTPFNDVVIGAATTYDVPLIDVKSAMDDAPALGLSEDGVHPSIPPDSNTANFSDVGYGYTIRNLTALQALDAVWRQVLSY